MNRVNPAANSATDPILQRRQQLRSQRRWRVLQACWRTLAISSLAGGLVWAASLPEWKLQQPTQVEIKGNRWLSTQTLAAFLPLFYPQSLLRLQTQEITTALKSHAPVERVTLTRQLFPPRLIVEVQDRPPVAIAQCDRCVIKKPAPAVPQLGPASVWLLDPQGTVMPLASYPTLANTAQLPKLTVSGFLQPTQAPGSLGAAQVAGVPATVDSQRQAQWSQIYQAVAQSPVSVSAIDWQDPNNLVLQTEMGTVHLGGDRTQLPEQLKALDQMRSLPEYVNLNQVVHIDLKNPQRPLIKTKNSQSELRKK